MTQYVLKLADVQGRVAFVPPAESGARTNIKRELAKCREKHNGFVLVTLQPPKRPRTTGESSQNHHLNGHIIQICNERRADVLIELQRDVLQNVLKPAWINAEDGHRVNTFSF